jgi:hypothetical protein
MASISTHSLFGNKPLAEEQLILLDAFEQAGLGSIYGDPRIIGSYNWETVMAGMTKDRRRELSIHHFNTAVKLIERIL